MTKTQDASTTPGTGAFDPTARHSKPDDAARLAALFDRGTPHNTRRAYTRDLRYLTAWKNAALNAPLAWPEPQATAIRFLLDHAEDPRVEGAPARPVMQRLIDLGLRRGLAPPAPATLRRYIATWRALHRLRGLSSPFDDPLVKTQLAKACRAADHRPAKRSPNAITLDVLKDLIAALPRDRRGLRDRAMFLFAWASGGRRASEVAGLHRAMLDLKDYEAERFITTRLHRTKTTDDDTPPLPLHGVAAEAMTDWLEAAGIETGWVFRRMDNADRIHTAPLTPAGVNHILRQALERAGYDRSFASAHGFRSGFLTEAARQAVPIQEAMALSLHKSVQQAVSYYREADIKRNRAAKMIKEI